MATNFYESGISNVVLWIWDTTLSTPAYKATGVDWTGVTSISETAEGGEPTAIYADNVKYLDIMSNEQVKATIEAYQFPSDWKYCDGIYTTRGMNFGQQERRKFCLGYVTKVGSEDGLDTSEKLHILYNCIASPADKQYQTIAESADAMTYSYSVSTTPVPADGTWLATTYKPTALITIDKRHVPSAKASAYTTLKTALFTTKTFKKPAEIISALA